MTPRQQDTRGRRREELVEPHCWMCVVVTCPRCDWGQTVDSEDEAAAVEAHRRHCQG